MVPRFAALLVAVLMVPHVGQSSSSEQWHMLAAHSQARFRVRLLGVLVLDGSFDDLSGVIWIDTGKGTARVSATINSASLRMRNQRFADWARSEEFFATTAYPQINFDSAEFPLAVLTDGGRIEGLLSLRGNKRKVEFRVAASDCAVTLHRRCAIEVIGSLRRSDFGMQSRRATVSDRVALRMQIVATQGSPASE